MGNTMPSTGENPNTETWDAVASTINGCESSVVSACHTEDALGVSSWCDVIVIDGSSAADGGTCTGHRSCFPSIHSPCDTSHATTQTPAVTAFVVGTHAAGRWSTHQRGDGDGCEHHEGCRPLLEQRRMIHDAIMVEQHRRKHGVPRIRTHWLFASRIPQPRGARTAGLECARLGGCGKHGAIQHDRGRV